MIYKMQLELRESQVQGTGSTKIAECKQVVSLCWNTIYDSACMNIHKPVLRTLLFWVTDLFQEENNCLFIKNVEKKIHYIIYSW